MRGLVINGFLPAPHGGYGYGIQIGGDNNIVEGNFIGTDPSGLTATGNGNTGVNIGGGHGNIVGGTNAAARNVISGNQNFGIDVCCSPNSGGNIILGNYIGTDANGTKKLANGMGGVRIGYSGNVVVGGPAVTERNVISGNISDGLLLAEPETTNGIVQGNYIGVQSDGSSPLGNTGHGVSFENGASHNLIGGIGSGDGNVIAFNGGDGIGSGGGRLAVGLSVRMRFWGTPSIPTAISGSIFFFGINPVTTNVTVSGINSNVPCNTTDGENHLQNYARC